MQRVKFGEIARAALVASAFVGGSVARAQDAGAPTSWRWAGHQVTVTARKVPLLGTIETRQDVFMVADVVRDGDTLSLVEQPCQITLRSGSKVEVLFARAAVQNIPPARIRYAFTGSVWSGSWTGGWGERDVDGDGKAGFGVGVDAPVCDGTMQIATLTATSGTARSAGGGLDGNVRIALERNILSTDSACLSLVPKHTEEVVSGSFVYRPVPAGATCASLLADGWPVRMP
jgi:hypothetical protein